MDAHGYEQLRAANDRSAVARSRSSTSPPATSCARSTSSRSRARRRRGSSTRTTRRHRGRSGAARSTTARCSSRRGARGVRSVGAGRRLSDLSARERGRRLRADRRRSAPRRRTDRRSGPQPDDEIALEATPVVSAAGHRDGGSATKPGRGRELVHADGASERRALEQPRGGAPTRSARLLPGEAELADEPLKIDPVASRRWATVRSSPPRSWLTRRHGDPCSTRRRRRTRPEHFDIATERLRGSRRPRELRRFTWRSGITRALHLRRSDRRGEGEHGGSGSKGPS